MCLNISIHKFFWLDGFMSRFKFEWKQKPAFGESNNTLKRFKTYQSFKSIMKYNQIPIFHSALPTDQQLHLISIIIIATGSRYFVCWSDMNSISAMSVRKLWTFSWYRAGVFLRDISSLSLRWRVFKKMRRHFNTDCYTRCTRFFLSFADKYNACLQNFHALASK